MTRAGCEKHSYFSDPIEARRDPRRSNEEKRIRGKTIDYRNITALSDFVVATSAT
jgi:hypothetical protein